MRTLQLNDELSSPHLHELALKLRSSKRTVFVAGAGISCNAGIPDFRSKDGLYALVKKEFPSNFTQGKDLFDTILFRDEQTTQIFYSFMAGLRDATLNAEPTATHRLLTLLKTKKKLMRCYTQNIDGLEEKAGLGPKDTIQLHGDIHTLKCSHCQSQAPWNPEFTQEMQDGDAPDCLECVSSSMARQMSGKRAVSVGTLRPDIVLYGEEHPRGDEIAMQLKKDCARKPQLLIVAGTSLKVIGIKRLVKSLAQATRSAGGLVVFVNKSPIAKSEWDGVFDYHVMSDTDEWISNVKSFIPSFFEKQTKIKVERKHPSSTATTKSAKASAKAGFDTPDNIANDLSNDPLAAIPEPKTNDTANLEPKKEPKKEPQHSRDETPVNDAGDSSFRDDSRSSIEPLTPQHNDSHTTEMIQNMENIKREYVDSPVFMPAKRTKSDPYGETMRQNELLGSPTKRNSLIDDDGFVSSQDTIAEKEYLDFR